ncbi:hypothetical protein [Hymenobacter norwichensis]|uniref:hypothetical protein n=1 Tax=Hymenobacter norwichensis TaxID=223903 RepID=UPI0003B63303|nr:hypothetical protein [Hymenobacter norwichensis]
MQVAPFNQQESSALLVNFQQQNYHQFSYGIIRKVLEAKHYHSNESLVVNALMEVMGNVLDQFKVADADPEFVQQLSAGLYNLLLQVECVEAN